MPAVGSLSRDSRRKRCRRRLGLSAAQAEQAVGELIGLLAGDRLR